MKLTNYQKKFFADNPDAVWPLCKCGCGNKVLLDASNPNSVFRQFASATCSRKSKTVAPNIIELLSNKEWLFEQRITLKKSKENIASELGISVSPINSWLKKHGLDGIRLNESAHKVQLILNNKDKLETDYSTGKTLAMLAEEYGTSSATLSRFFAKHGIVTRDPNSYDRNNSCSNEEKELADWVRSIVNEEIIQSSRSIIPPQELDIIIPSKKIAIEYNGLYSHIYRPDQDRESIRKGPEYHLGKLEKSFDKGYHLIHIFSDQWKKNQTAVKTMLMSKLGCNNKVYARNCIVKEIDTSTKNTFLNQYHLQGADKSNHKLGLFYKDELVAVMTFGRPRFSKKYEWELIRFSGKLGISVVGGFSRLLKHFVSEYGKAGERIVSYADRCHSSGNVYKTNGFDLEHINKPSYHYVNLNTESRHPRTSYTKKRMLDLMGIEQSDKSESEIARDIGLEKIFDCGTMTFVYSI